MNMYKIVQELVQRAGLDWHKGWPAGDDEMNKFEVLVILALAHEREECAKMVDHILKEGGGTYGDAIRARSRA